MLLYDRGDNKEIHIFGAEIQLNLCLTDWNQYLKRARRGRSLVSKGLYLGEGGEAKEKILIPSMFNQLSPDVF